MQTITVRPNRKLFVLDLNIGLDIKAVAPVNYGADGTVFDWAVYIGCGDPQHVAEQGEKMLRTWAAAMFPDLPADSYRE